MVTADGENLYQACGGAICLDFTNTVDRPAARSRWVDHLRDFDDLCAWSEQAGLLPAAGAKALKRLGRSQAAAAEAVMQRARSLREAIFRVFSAIAHNQAPRKSDLNKINTELSRALFQARVKPARGGYVWAWNDGSKRLDSPLWPIVESAATLLTSRNIEIKECASDDCLWLFIDATKNNRRRWCDMKSCGNRAKVREHRRRKRTARE